MFRKIGKKIFVYTALFYTSIMDKTGLGQDHHLIGLIIKFVNHFDPTEIYVLGDNLESNSRNASFCQTLSKGLQGAGYLKIEVVTNATRSIGVNGRDLSRNVVVISLSKAESIFRARLFKTAGRSTFRPVYKHELNSHDWRKGDSRLKALFQSRPFLLYF